MLKKDTLGNASAKSLGEAFRCGECLHHTKSCHPNRENVCSKLGVRSFAVAPKCFTPDVTKVIQNAEQFVILSSLFNSYTPGQKRILLGMLRGAKQGAKHFRFGTKLYLSTGGDYLTSYRCGYVVGYSSGGELILAGSADRKSAGITFFAYIKDPSDLLTHKDWVVKRKELLEKGRIDSARSLPRNVHLDKYLNYEVPSIDTAPEFFEKNDTTKRRRTRRVQELHEFIVS